MKFQVFRNGKLVDDFQLCGAYLSGADGITIRRARISFKDGVIECAKPNMESAGFTLLWPVEGFGKVLLPTTCLPEREQPYNLNVEIARAKLMQIINKREDWSMFNKLEGLTGVWEEAQALLIQAVQNISTPPLASKLADQSLQKAVSLSEKLTAKQAKSLFVAKNKKRGFGRGSMGCKVDPSQIEDPEYVKHLLDLFSFVTVPIKWSQIEPQKGHYDFSSVDKCLKVLLKKKLAFGAGPLLHFSKEDLPQWLIDSDAEFEKIRERAYQFVMNVVTRYSKIVRLWFTISGINAVNDLGFSFEQVLEITRAANMAVKAASDRAVKIIEITNPWGEYYSTTPHTIPPMVYIDMIVHSGINFDAFALKMPFGRNQAGMHIRDMMHLSSVLDRFAAVGKPLYITDAAVPSQNDDSLQSPDLAGQWHKQWDQAQQGIWIEQFYQIALSKPFIDSVIYSNLADTKQGPIADSGLLTSGFESKKSFQTMKKLRKCLSGGK